MTTRQWLYFYDQGGNRTIKSEIIAQRQIHYTYDINDVPMYGSANNRLMFYATYNTSGRSSTLESTTDYYYNDLGNVTRVVTDKENTAPGERRFDSTSPVVGRREKPLRMLTERDVLNRVVAHHLDPLESIVNDLMPTPVGCSQATTKPADSDGSCQNHGTLLARSTCVSLA